jgi:hypothetical protein
VRGLSLFYPAQLPTRATPLVFPWTIEMFGSGPVVENLELVNSYQGIYSHIGQRHTVRNVKGQPLLFGLYASQLLDTSLFENINFVPIYMWSTTEGPPYTIHNLEQWRHKNGTAFKFGRVDNAVCSNLFTYMSFIGFKFVIDPAEGTSYAGGTGAPGGRAWVQFNSCGADTCAYPVDIDDVQGADATSAVGVDFSDGFFAAATWPGISFSPTPPLHAVYARGTFTGRLGLSNCRSNLAAKTIVCEGNGRINVDQFYFQAWTSNAVVVSAGDVSVTGSTFKQGSATPVILVTGSPWLTVAGNVIEYDDTGTTIFSISATANFSEAGNVDALGCKWETQAMGNSWVNYGAGYHDVAYRKQDGKVRFRGTIKNGTTGVLFTLPARYRPPGHAFFTLPNNNSFANVQVATDGQVQIATLNNNVSLSLDQIQYSIR